MYSFLFSLFSILFIFSSEVNAPGFVIKDPFDEPGKGYLETINEIQCISIYINGIQKRYILQYVFPYDEKMYYQYGEMFFVSDIIDIYEHRFFPFFPEIERTSIFMEDYDSSMLP